MVKTKAADDTMLETAWESRWLPDSWGRSSVGRAPALQAGGQEFESLRLHSVSFLTEISTLKTVYRNDYNKRKNVISQTSKRRFKIKDQESKSIQIKN